MRVQVLPGAFKNKMEKIKIAFFETEDWEKEYLENHLKNFDIIFFKDKINSLNLKKIKDVNILSTFIYSKIDKKVLNSLKNLKYITTRSTGFDHIDLKSCKRKNILVSNVPTYGENTVAEHTFALILTLSRKIYPAVERVKRGDFSLDNLTGFDLKNKTLGVIGVGHIGKNVIKIAKGFQMKILAYDVVENKKLAKKMGFRFVSFEDLLKNSDIVTLHVPYNKKTHHLINIKNLKLFKKGAILINTSRGGICDATTLVKGIKENIFSGLGLDVLEEESFIKEERELLSSIFRKKTNLKSSYESLKTALENHMLINQENVIITPHNAFNSQESLTKISETTVKNIKSFIKGKPINLVIKK